MGKGSGEIPFSVEEDSIVIEVTVNGQRIYCILDTGDAIGPVFNSQDAEQLRLKPTGEIGVSGAGGATENQTTTATITLGQLSWDNEPGSIDSNLQGHSLLGLPFFLAKCSYFSFDLHQATLYLEAK